MKLKTKYSNRRKDRQRKSACLILTIILSLLSMDVTYAWQSDPRIPAGDHALSAELAPAIGRIRSGSNTLVCTAWIAQGGVLITAGHCDINGDILEFNVPLNSGSCGQLVAADAKDQYVINNIVASNNSGGGNDWKIFEVEDNPITGYQPIEAQLKYIHFVKKNVDNSSVQTIRFIDHANDTDPHGPCYDGSLTETSKRNSKRGTLQTYTGVNVTASSSAAKLEVGQVTPEGGASGGPLIDENTGEAIAIVNAKDSYLEGTTLHRSGLWNAFQATQNPFTLTVTQKNASGGYLTGSTISRWDVYLVPNHPVGNAVWDHPVPSNTKMS